MIPGCISANVIALGRVQSGTARLATDPNAPGGHCIAVRVTEQPGAIDLTMPTARKSGPGYYRVSLPVCIHTRPKFNTAYLKLGLNFSATNTVWLPFVIAPCQLNGTPDAWTVLTRTVLAAGRLAVQKYPEDRLEFYHHTVGQPKSPRTAFEYTTNVLESTGLDIETKGSMPRRWIFSTRWMPTRRRPLAQIDYPAILVGDPVIEPVSTTYMVDKVWPEYLHIYPGGTNPVEVTVRNFTSQPATAQVRLEMQTGLDENALVGQQTVTIPARGIVKAQFPWVAGLREFGYGAMATLLIDGKPIHTATEYFSVSTPIWKTAIQGSGFITWYGRDYFLKPHVEANRKATT